MAHVYGAVLVAMLSQKKQIGDHARPRRAPATCACAVKLCVRDNSDGWLVVWGLLYCMLVRSSAVWLLPFTLL